MCEYETWVVILGRKFRVRCFERRFLRKIFVTEKQELKGNWINLRNEELHDVFTAPHEIRVINNGE
jgi:hypothetical protein